VLRCGVQIGAHDVLDKAKSAHPREFFGQVARFNVGQKFLPLHALAGGIQAPGAVQAIGRLVKAPGDLGGDPFDNALKLVFRIQVDCVLPPQGTARRHARPEQKHRQRLAGAGAQSLSKRSGHDAVLMRESR
jgi:hypothetical protein